MGYIEYLGITFKAKVLFQYFKPERTEMLYADKILFK